MYTYIIKFRYQGCVNYHTLESSSKQEVIKKFKKLRIKPRTLADVYIVRYSCKRGSIFLSNGELEKYMIK